MKNRGLYRLFTRTADIGCNIFFTLTGIIFTALALITVFFTCKVDLYSPVSNENVLYLSDNAFLNIFLLIMIAAFFVLCWKFRRYILKIPVKVAAAALIIYTTCFSVWWIFSVSSIPAADPGVIANAAGNFARGDMSALLKGDSYYGGYSYFQFYPFQLGYTAFCEIIFRLFRTNNWMLLQIINVIMLDAVYLGLITLCHIIFKKRGVTLFCTAALAFCLQGIFFTTFVYGNISGLAFGIWAVVFTIISLKGGKYRFYLIPAAVCMGLSVLLKYNNMIILAAIVVMLFVDILRNRKLFSALCAVVLAVSAVGFSGAVTAVYEARSGVDIGGGVSQVLYADMGMHDSIMAPGWYNGIAMELYRNNNLNIDEAEAEAKEQMKERLKYFADNPAYTLNFYGSKWLSMWNEPEMESIWVSESKEHEHPIGSLGWVVYLSARDEINLFMSLYQTVVYAGFAGAMFNFRKIKLPAVTALPAAVFGGMVYHMIFEAKSQYILTYFIVMVPFSVYGIYRMFCGTCGIVKKNMIRKNNNAAVQGTGQVDDNIPV